ncbi:MAG: LysR family transcriptional regulator [Selenomonadaceae bacterium]|nr:LysR family transcriptional regulator [Selenomonadaceae bacterium]
MTLNQMRYFCEVCRWKNISQAAEKLHVAQPTVSVAMQALEKETGLNLFYREKNKIILTPEANLLLGRISSILKRVDKLEQDIQSMAENHSPIRLAIPVQLGFTFIPALLGDFCLRHPEIELEVVEMGGVTALRMVEENKLDLAFTNFHTSAGEPLSYYKLLECECFFCTWPDHALAGKASVTMEEIASEPLVLLDNHFITYRLVHEAFGKAGCAPNVLHYTPYLHTAKNLVRQHIASAILIRQSILPEDKQMVIIPFKDAMIFDSGIVTKKEHQIRPDERILINYLRKIAGQSEEPVDDVISEDS